MVTEQGTTATRLQRRKSVALNVFHNQGSTSAWLQNLVKGSGHKSLHIDDEIDMAFSQEILYEVIDLFCMNPEGVGIIALPKHTCTARDKAASEESPIVGVVSISEALARAAAEDRVPEEKENSWTNVENY